MAAEGGTYLPPVVATLIGDSGDLAKTLVGAKAMLENFSKTPTTVDIKAEITPLAQLQLELFKDIADIKALADAHPVNVPMQLDMFQILSDTTIARMAIEDALNTPKIVAEIEPKVDVAKALVARSILSAIFARMTTGLAGGGGGGGGGNILGFGTGAFSLAPLFGWVAGFGSIAALAGFGVERVLTLALGLIGSLTQALMGLGVIAAGTFATMAVGMGSDMIVMKSTIADTQALYKSWTAVQDAITLYGKNSIQAHDATIALNNQMKLLGNTAGVQAELGLAKLAFTLNQQFDRATSQARVQAVGLLTQILFLGQAFVPLVAEAAQRNLAIINSSLMPLFTWLKGPNGMGIFTDLENKFAKNLPTAVDAFNQAIIFLLRFLDLASNYTGGFVQWLDRLFTYLNSPSGFARVKKDVNDVVAVFDVWKQFIIILFKDLALLFGQAVGVGTTMVSMLTGILTKLHDYLTSTSGKQAVGSLFQAHKDEIIAIISLIPKLAGPLAQIYISLAVPLTKIATAIANIVSWLLNIPTAGPVLAYAAAFFLLAQRMQLVAAVSGAIKLAGMAVGLLEFASAFRAFAAAEGVATAAAVAFDVAVDANVVAIVVLAIVALIAVIVLLVTHWKEVTAVVQRVWKDVTHWVGQIVTDVGKFFSDLGKKVEEAWSNFAARPGYWIGYMIGFITVKMLQLGISFDKWFVDLVKKVWNWGVNMAKGAPAALEGFVDAVFTEINKLPGQVFSIGTSIATGLWNGLKSMKAWLLTQLAGFLQGLIDGALHALGSHSPSTKFAEVGATIPQGLAVGVNRTAGTAMAALVAMFNEMQGVGTRMTRTGIGSPALAMAGGGRGPISLNAPITITMAPGSQGNPQVIAQAVQRAIGDEFDHLITRLQGGVYNTPGT